LDIISGFWATVAAAAGVFGEFEPPEKPKNPPSGFEPLENPEEELLGVVAFDPLEKPPEPLGAVAFEPLENPDVELLDILLGRDPLEKLEILLEPPEKLGLPPLASAKLAPITNKLITIANHRDFLNMLDSFHFCCLIKFYFSVIKVSK